MDLKHAMMKYRTFLFLILLQTSMVSFGQESPKLRYFMQADGQPGSKTQFGANPTAGRYVTAGDARIYFEIYGKGEPVIVLHGGIVGSTYEMGQIIDSLSKYYQVIAVSTRGHGRSEMGHDQPTYARKAEDVKAIIDVITTDSVTVLGFSDGAYTGYYLAARYPAKIKRLIAIGAGEWKKGFRPFKNDRTGLFALDSLYFKQQIDIMPQPDRFDAWLQTSNNVYNNTSIGKSVFGSIKCPVLVMAGEMDQNAPLRTVLAAYEMLPNARLSIIPDAPHPVFLTNFPAAWACIIPFLDH